MQPERETHADPTNDETMTVAASESFTAKIHKVTTEGVRQGHTGDHLRYVLGISFAAALVAMFATVLIFLG